MRTARGARSEHWVPCSGAAFGSVAIVIAACASPSAPDARSSVATLAAPSGAAPPVISPPAEPSVAGSTSGRPDSSAAAAAPAAASCARDSDCAWDDPCQATRCLGKPAAPPAACEESRPRPGECLCVAERCTLKPIAPPPPEGRCEVRGCDVDYARGVCVPDTHGVPENLRTNPRVEVGPSCDCIDRERGCTFQWFDPVPCKSELDCWVASSPRPHPVPRVGDKSRPFKACSDGPMPPLCNGGFCALGPPYAC